MINGFPIPQITIGPAQLDSGQGGAQTGSTAGTSFEGLLGSLLIDKGLVASASNSATDTASNTFRLSSDLIRFLHASGQINSKDSLSTVENSLPFGISELLEQALSLLNQVSDSKFAPLGIAFDLEKADLKGIDLSGIPGQNLPDSGAVALVRETDLQALLSAAANGGEISLPVLVLFKGDENAAGSFSLTPATLTLSSQQAGSISEQTDSSGLNELQYFLTFSAPSEQPCGLDQNSRPDNPDTELSALAARISALLNILADTGTDGLSGNRPERLEGLSGQTPASAGNPPVNTESTVENYIPINYTGTLAENASTLLKAVQAFLAKLESNFQDVAAGAAQAETGAPQPADTDLEKKTSQVLTNILRQALTRTIRHGEPQRLGEIVSMIDRLGRFEQLSAQEQKATLDSLVKEINLLLTRAGGQANTGLETLSVENGNPAQTANLSPPNARQIGLELTSSGADSGQPVGKLSAYGSGETTHGDIAGKDRIAVEIFPKNENTSQSSRLAGEQQHSSVFSAADSDSRTVKILSQAAGKISSLLSSIFTNSQNGSAASQTGTSPYQALGAVDQSNVFSAGVLNPDQVPAGEAAQTPGQNQAFKNGTTEGFSFRLEEMLQGSKAPAEKPNSASGAGNGQKINDIQLPGQGPLNSADPGGAAKMASGLDAAVKNPGMLSGITVPVKIVAGKPGRVSHNSATRYNAAVEYVKLSADGSGPSDKVEPGALSGLKEIKTEFGMEEMLKTLLGKGVDSDELIARLERGEVSDKVKADQLFQPLRSELSSLRNSAQKADQAPAARSSWPVNQAEVFEKVINAARLTRLGGTSEISMRLEPDHLGQMRIRLTLDDNHALTARIQVETQEARSLIENSLYRLKDSLAEQGLKVEKFSVDVRQDSNQQQSQTFTETHAEGGWRSHRGMKPEGEDLAFAAAEDNITDSAKGSKITVNKYSYSTLEWVA